MAKAGLRQLDGSATWDITALGKLLSMLFDECALFGGPLETPFHVKAASPRKSPVSRPDFLSNRSKTVDVMSRSERPNIVERYSSLESPKSRLVKTFDVDAMLSGAAQSSEIGSNIVGSNEDSAVEIDDISPRTSGEAGFKVDSQNDFMSALAASLDAESEDSSPKGTALERGFKPFSHGPAANRRRWNQTLPSKFLATIQESDNEDHRGSEHEPLGQLSTSLSKNKPSDPEMVLHPEEKKKKSRQMRVPQVKPKDDTVDPFSSFLDSIEPPTEKKTANKVGDSEAQTPEVQRTLATDDEDIETAGTAFLDQISKSMGFG